MKNVSPFHIHLMEAVDELMEITRKYRETKDDKEKKKYSRQFNAALSTVDVCLKKYDVDKLKFTVLDQKGRRKNAR